MLEGTDGAWAGARKDGGRLALVCEDLSRCMNEFVLSGCELMDVASSRALKLAIVASDILVAMQLGENGGGAASLADLGPGGVEFPDSNASSSSFLSEPETRR